MSGSIPDTYVNYGENHPLTNQVEYDQSRLEYARKIEATHIDAITKQFISVYLTGQQQICVSFKPEMNILASTVINKLKTGWFSGSKCDKIELFSLSQTINRRICLLIEC